MAQFNSLMEQLRRVARDVLPSDPLRSVHLTNMNGYTRVYLRRITQRAQESPFDFSVTDLQLAQEFHVSLGKFRQWFHHGVRLLKVFRRVRWFLREMIIMNILEDRGELGEEQEEDRHDCEKPIPKPNRRSMEKFKKLTKMIREAKASYEFPMENEAVAMEWLEIMQGGWSSSSNSVASNRTSIGENPADEHSTAEQAFESIEFAIFNGPAVIPIELLDQFKDNLVIDDAGDNAEVLLSVHDQDSSH